MRQTRRVRTVRLRVRLRDVEPIVERVIDVPSASRLPELHELLQAATGWVDAHLHEFVAGEQHFGVPDPDGLDDQVSDETLVGLSALGPRWIYRYDFGDDWVHDVEVLGPGGDQVACVGGRGGCPLEDCGGPPGYERARAALSDPGHEDHAHYRAWIGRELPSFDLDATDTLVGQVAGSVPETVRALLAEIGDGVALTPGGRLPRRVVRGLQQQRPHWSLSGKPAHMEEDLLPAAALHDVLRGVGLLRVRRGTLVKIKAAEDDLEVLRRLRSWFGPSEGFRFQLATDTAALLATEGAIERRDLHSRVFELLGHRWARADGRPVAVEDINAELSRIRATLESLDVVTSGGREWRPGPSARTLLPRAAALAQLWDPHTTPTQPHYASRP